MGVKRTGDWKKAKRMLSGERFRRLSQALEQATHKAALLLVREIVKGIHAQAPGGKAFVPNAESTIRKKKSSKALIDDKYLVNSITHKIIGDKAFVGLLRGAENKAKEDLVNIGAIMEYGATIQHPNGATIIIPPRPFLHPVMVKHQDDVIAFYRDALGSFFDSV